MTDFTQSMARPFFVLVCLSLFVSACTQRLICPAYQSAFIYDKDELRKKFSYFQEDSTPKILTASKTRYLIAEPVSYRKKVRSIQTVPMKDVNVTLPDSIAIDEGEGLLGEDGVIPGAELDLAARSVIDSIYIVDVPQGQVEEISDSVYVISKDREVRFLKYNFPDSLMYDENTGRYVARTPKYVETDVRFNVEQDNYMWYLRKNLILPDVRLSQLMQAEDRQEERKREKKSKGFFRNLFKKKKKEPIDSAVILPAPRDENDFDFIDETDQAQPAQTTQAAEPVKKGMFSFLKKKEKAEKPPKEKKKKEKKVKDTAPPEEEVPAEEKKEDDGF